MILIWGSNLYGKVDEIPGLGHVATKFGHLYYIPLIPFGSHFVTSQTSDGWQGASVSLSPKSILMAWFRTLAVLACIGGLIFMLATISNPKADLFLKIFSVMVLIGGIGMFFIGRSNWAKQASYERAKQISKDLQFDQRLEIYIDLTYERISQDEADRQMTAIDASLESLENLDDEIHDAGIDQRIETS